jgi:hypothetical protein
MAIENTHSYSTTSGTTPTAQITDEVDYPHSGLIKALSKGMQGNYAIKGSATDFDITFADGGSFTTIAVTTGKAYRDGKLETITALSATDMNTTYDSGTGAVDITPLASDDVYLILVAKADNTMVLRGSNATPNRVPDLLDDDIPIAIIKIVAGSADDSISSSERLVQFLTTSKVKNELSIGRDNSGYTEGLTVKSNSGDIEIEAKEQDKDIIFKVNDGGTPTEVMRIDGSESRVGIGTNSPDAPFHVKTGGIGDTVIIESTDTGGGGLAPDVVLKRNTSVASEELGNIRFLGLDNGAAEQEYADMYAGINTNTAGNESGEIFLRTTHNGTLRRRLDITKNEVVINEDSIDSNFRVESNGNVNMIFVDAGNDRVGIGTNSPDAPLHVETSGAGDAVIIESTDAGATEAPDLVLYRNSASPAASDEIGSIRFRGKDNAAGDKDYNRITSVIRDTTAASADADLIFQSLSNSIEIEMMKISRIDGIVINEIGANYINTRIESDNNANMFFVDAANDRVGIGTNSCDTDLHVDNKVTLGALRGRQVVEVTNGAGSTYSINEDTDFIILCRTDPFLGNLTLTAPTASGTTIAQVIKINCTLNSGGADDCLIDVGIGEQLQNETGAVLTTPYSLTTGGVYELVGKDPTTWLLWRLA